MFQRCSTQRLTAGELGETVGIDYRAWGWVMDLYELSREMQRDCFERMQLIEAIMIQQEHEAVKKAREETLKSNQTIGATTTGRR